jgi:hypothetical protein
MIKEIMGVKEKPDIIDITERKRLQWYGHIKRMQDERLPKLIYGVDTRGKKKKRTSKKNMDGRCTRSHENKTLRIRSVVKQRGMVFEFRKTATAVTRPERYIDIDNIIDNINDWFRCNSLSLNYDTTYFI